ncbi:MAG TPA: hypothetical protein VMF52_10755 [Steroidobacteraceae bacterium]|nr:hypothetical protein [Steroidobacteraceae bacterium]
MSSPDDELHEGWRIRSPEIDAPALVLRKHNARTGALVEKVVGRMREAVAAKQDQDSAAPARRVDKSELERELVRANEQLAGLRRRQATADQSGKRDLLIRAAEARASSIELALKRAQTEAFDAATP